MINKLNADDADHADFRGNQCDPRHPRSIK